MFSGGSLLYGATGRPDLLGPEHTHALVHHQHASAHRLAELLPDEAEVYPTHGFGSFCSATQSDATTSTIGREKQANPVLTQDEQTYVEELLAGLGPWPAYYAHMAPANAAGPAEPDLTPPAVADATELRRRIEAGEWVVDLRHRTAFAAGHAPGTLNFGLDGGFATYLGWLAHLGHADHAPRRDRRRTWPRRSASWSASGSTAPPPTPPAARRTGATASPARSRRRRSPTSPRYATTARSSSSTYAAADEHDAARIDGAVNIPLHELWDRLDEVPDGRGVGALRRRLPRVGRRLDARRRRAHARRDRRLLRPRRAGGPAPRGARRVIELLLAVVAGALIGLSLGALGGGGSILAVPVLLALGQSPAQATTGSLVVVGVTSLAGAVTARRAGSVLLARGIAFGTVAIGGAVAGAHLSSAVPEPVLLAAFSALMLVVAGADDGPSAAQPAAVPGRPRMHRSSVRSSTTRSSRSARPSCASAPAPSRCS